MIGSFYTEFFSFLYHHLDDDDCEKVSEILVNATKGFLQPSAQEVFSTSDSRLSGMRFLIV